jgi:two-component system, OmpR family, response regulator
MLVLSRRPNQKIVFPASEIAVQVLSIKPGAVRLGIEAPPEVEVLREELAANIGRQAGAGLQRSENMPRTRLAALEGLVQKRLAIAEKGLAVLREQLLAGLHRDAVLTLDELQEDVRLLQERLGSEARIVLHWPAGTPATPKRKALLVEDNPQERELMALCLRSEGLDVDTAGDGCDALDYLRTRERPDVVLLDMGLPRVDGPTTVREIRSDPCCAGLKIFAVSGHSAEEYKLPIGPAGVDRWFQKPVDPMSLVQNLARELEPSAGQP